MDSFSFRAQVSSRQLQIPSPPPSLQASICLQYSPVEVSETIKFDTCNMRKLMDGHNLKEQDWMHQLVIQSQLFGQKERGGRVFVSPDYNLIEMTMKRIEYLERHGVFNGCLTRKGPQNELRMFSSIDVCSVRGGANLNLGKDASFLQYEYLDRKCCFSEERRGKLCSELRPHALALVKSFSIPDAFLSPIAFAWVEPNSWSSVQN